MKLVPIILVILIFYSCYNAENDINVEVRYSKSKAAMVKFFFEQNCDTIDLYDNLAETVYFVEVINNTNNILVIPINYHSSCRNSYFFPSTIHKYIIQEDNHISLSVSTGWTGFQTDTIQPNQKKSYASISSGKKGLELTKRDISFCKNIDTSNSHRSFIRLEYIIGVIDKDSTYYKNFIHDYEINGKLINKQQYNPSIVFSSCELSK